jgi:hypothetical protein
VCSGSRCPDTIIIILDVCTYYTEFQVAISIAQYSTDGFVSIHGA